MATKTEVLSARDVAALLRLSEKTVRRVAGEGRLPAQRVGRAWRFSRLAIMEWLATSEAELA